MTQHQSNITYALLALALAASLLYQPVIAGPDADRTPGLEPASQAVPESLRQDLDALIREIESRAPAPMPAEIVTVAGTAEEQLEAARIQIGILQQAVVAALAARAEAEVELEVLWRDSRAAIDALKAAPEVTPTGGADIEGEAPADVRTTARESPDATPAVGAVPTEVMLSEIHFDPGSAELTPGGERKTLEAAERIKALGARNVRVSGYTDTQGPAAYNMHLSLQRAKSIAGLLQSVGVPATIIEVEGHGEEGAPEPTADQVSEPLNRCAGIFAMVDLPDSQR